MSGIRDPLPISTPDLREAIGKFVTGESGIPPGMTELQCARMLLSAAYCRLAQEQRDMPFAEVVAESERVMSVFAAPEWDCLNEDGKAWAAAIAEEARMIERGAVIDMLSIEHKKWIECQDESAHSKGNCHARAEQCRVMANYIGNGGHWK